MLDIKKDYELILDNIAGLIIIDKNSKILYISRKTAGYLGMTREELIGRDSREVMDSNTNRLYRVLQTGKEQIGESYFYEGITMICNGYPLYKNGELVGAFEFDIFESASILNNFIKKLEKMSNELDYYKNEYKNMQTTRYSIDNIMGNSKAILNLKEKIKNTAMSNSNVLIQGETGCGKELVANAIHSSSQRNLNKFVAINCSAIPSGLFESEFYGYEEGSFTGAVKGGRKGKVELANGGTLFLDEIDQLPITDQPKLLRFLQEKEIMKVGGTDNIAVDVRIVCATNRDLKQLVINKEFREDLYYRLNVIELNLVPLRERKEDIPIIAADIIHKLNKSMGRVSRTVEEIDPEVEKLLCEYDWPGNVRELQNILERAMNTCYDRVLTIEHFKDFIIARGIDNEAIRVTSNCSLEDVKNNAEKAAIINVQKSCDGNKAKMAKILGISRETLYQKLKKYDIDV